MRPATKHAVPPAGDICRLSAVDLADAIRRRRLSVREVVTAFLDRIDAVNPLVNAIVSLRDRADILREADKTDAHLAHAGHAGPLFGLPIAIKDLAQTKGLRTSFGSPIFADFVPQEDDFFVERIRKAGAIIIGKTNVPEFGLGSNTYNAVFGPTLNAFDPALTAGGSSGGAAVALALDMVPVADGSDFGGSLRNPAAYNNIYGFRPSQGLVPAGPELDVFHAQMGVEGPMGRSVRDMALLLDEQAGYDPRAPLSHHKQDCFLQGLQTPTAGGRIAWFGDLGGHLPVEPGIPDLCEAALGRFAAASFQTEALVPDVDFEALWQAFVRLRQASSGCALKAHYDDPLKRALLKPEAAWEVEQALQLTAPQIHAATVRRSSWHRTLLSLFDRFDLIALPTAQVFPFDVLTHWPTQVAGRAMDSYHRWMQVSALATLGGCPVVNVPAGFDGRGRPMGMQLIGRPRGDMAVLRAAAAYETTLPWPAGA
ncbi:amidase [Mesorhizobium sp.]|uniref:amidase n=2 Tax=Mesorhizobium sp. TaxID=1871066 RepID=UPI000FE7EDD8|nr:amidase [Mesorhizobium sp.]RWK41891.1 MAG: amidase [Mesorhizobium sp.]RWK66667.1 MAG: amidase [Mesorhizobium sp.]RWK75309.1 MAG: amidase [Mesorhizobium sp.]RWK78007.1 MAG: amidase [Mesorhizobium sp.]RWL02517.1 MAG: amidase [Mesorhizobium sp.]